jgi:hypothetical protein
MTHYKHTIKSVIEKLEPEAVQIDSDEVSDVFLASLAISMKRIADYMDEIEYVIEPEKEYDHRSQDSQASQPEEASEGKDGQVAT